MPTIKDTLNGWIDYSAPKLGTVLARTWKDQRQAITYKEIREAIERGELDMSYLAQWRQDYSRFITNAYAPLAQEAINNSAKALETMHGIGARSLTFPYLDAFIADKGGKLIRDVSEEQYKAINVLVRQASMSDTMDAAELAYAIRPTIGLTRRQSQWAYNRYVTARDEGYTEKQARDIQIRYAERLHRKRAQTIAITEMAFAYNYGQQAYMEQCIKDGFIGGCQKQWVTALDERVCEVCGKLDLEIAEMDAPFSNGVIAAPAHPRCRCQISYINVTKPNDWVETAEQEQEQPQEQPKEPDYIGDTGEGYTEEQQEEIKKLVADAEPTVRDMWVTQVPNLKPVMQDTKPNEGFFRPRDQHVHFRISRDVAGRTDQNPYSLRFHEYGHNIDYDNSISGASYLSGGYKNASGQTFRETLLSECEAAVKDFFMQNRGDYITQMFIQADAWNGIGRIEFGEKLIREWKRATGAKKADADLMIQAIRDADANGGLKGLVNIFINNPLVLDNAKSASYDAIIKNKSIGLMDDFCKHVKKTYSIRERTDISDMFAEYSTKHGGNSYPFGIGHTANYWKDSENLPCEAFAEMTSASISQKESLETIKKFFPRSYQFYLEMIRSIT